MNFYFSIIFFFLFSYTFSATYYVATNGSNFNRGTIAAPWATWQKAFNTAQPGDTVYFRGGIYMPTTPASGNNITHLIRDDKRKKTEERAAKGYICFFNYPGENPILDCSLIDPKGRKFNTGLLLMNAHFYKFSGLTIRNVWQKYQGVTAGGIGASDCSNLSFENITIYNIGGPGITYLGAVGYSNITYDSICFINCDVYNCCDSLFVNGNLGGLADGFKYDNEPGAYALFQGCRAWNNSDDGFNSTGSGIVEFINCWAFKNGYLQGDGCGFKVGAHRINTDDTINLVKNCISAYNRSIGFMEITYYDYYSANIKVLNNIFYKNDIGIQNFSNFLGNWRHNLYRNNISYDNRLDLSIHWMRESHNTWDTLDLNDYYGWPWWKKSDTVTVTNKDFISLNPQQLTDPRQDDGTLPRIDFLRLANGSDLKGAGLNVGMSKKPDIGIDWYYFESK